MALSYVTYSATGGTNYSVTFPYIAQADVSVYVDGVLQVEGAGNDYTWFSATVIQFTAGSTPTPGQVINIRRTTTDTARLVDFQDAGNLTEYDLDLSANQMFYLVQEGLDNTNDLSMQLDTDNKWNAETHIIKNVGDPVSAQDAVTKNYLDVTWTAYMDASVAAAAASEAAAAASETAAAASAAAAATSYDNFDDRYLGQKASDPTLDNDGDPLITGALYFNTTSGNMMVYNGSAWLAIEMFPSIAANALKHLRVNAGGTATEWFDLFGTANTWTAQMNMVANGGSMYTSQAYDVAHDAAFQGFQTRDSLGVSRGFVGSIPSDGASYVTMYTWDTTLGTPAWNRVFGAAPNAGDLELGATNITWEGKVLANLTDAQTFVGVQTFSANPRVSKTNPALDLWDTGVADQNYRMIAAAGTFYIQERNDADSSGTNPLVIETGANTLTIVPSGLKMGGSTIYRPADNTVLSFSGGTAVGAANAAYMSLYGNSHATYPGVAIIVPGSTGEAWIYNGATSKVFETITGGVQVNGTLQVNSTTTPYLVVNGGTGYAPQMWLKENGNQRGIVYYDSTSHYMVMRKYLDSTPATVTSQMLLYDNGDVGFADSLNSITFYIGGTNGGGYYKCQGEQQMKYHGRVASGGTSNRSPSGWTTSRVAAGQYRVTHNLGTSAYTVTASHDGVSSGVRIGSINRGTTYFDIYCYGYNNTTGTDLAVQWTMCRD